MAKKVAKKTAKKAPATKKKTVAKKAASSKKTTTKKAVSKKVTAKKKAAAKPAAQATKKVAAKKTTAKATAKKKPAAKKVASKAGATAKPAAKKAATKKKAEAKPAKKAATAEKTTTQKAATKKAASKKVSAAKTAEESTAKKKTAAKKSAADTTAKETTAAAAKKSALQIEISPLESTEIKRYARSSAGEYMNEDQKAHFRKILAEWKVQLMKEVDRTVGHMKDDATNFPDPNDRATQEEEFSLELRTRDRERKLIKKINEAQRRLDDDEYGYCEQCGIEIGYERLEARPTAELCFDCKTLEEKRERQIA